MKEAMRAYMKTGLILHMAYPEIGKGDGPVPDRLDRIVADPYFDAVEVMTMKDPAVRREAAERIAVSGLEAYYGAQYLTLSSGLNPNDLEEEGRRAAVEVLKRGIDEAYELGCRGLSFLSGHYQEETKQRSLDKLTETTREICAYAREKGKLSVCCEIFDYDMDKKALIGPAPLAKTYAERIFREFDNFGLLVDLSHIPMLREDIRETVLTLKDYIRHAHMGNNVIRPGYPAYGDNHPRFGFPNSENGPRELAEYLRALIEIGYLNPVYPGTVSFEVKPFGTESPGAVIANAKRTLNAAWLLV